MQTAQNPQRGCGTLKKGGYYLQSKSSPDGTLRAWTWLLGSGVLDDAGTSKQPLITCPPRQMEVISLIASIDAGLKIYDAEKEELAALWKQYGELPHRVILDHVGKCHYPTPLEFAVETRMYGPSRRIPGHIARVVANRLPIPVIFTHSVIPLASKHDINGFVMLHGLNVGPVSPTWDWKGFGMTVAGKKDVGSDHWQTFAWTFKDDLAQFEKTETIFGASWITDVVYVTGADDDPDEDDLWNAGITPVVIED